MVNGTRAHMKPMNVYGTVYIWRKLYCNWYRNFPFIFDPLFIYHSFILFIFFCGFWIQMILELVDTKPSALACNYCVSMNTRTHRMHKAKKKIDLMDTQLQASSSFTTAWVSIYSWIYLATTKMPISKTRSTIIEMDEWSKKRIPK